VVEHLAAFFAVSVLVIVTPGQDTALTIRNTLLGGRGGGVSTALGVSTGQAVWALATSVGLSALLAASHPLFVALRIAGAAYPPACSRNSSCREQAASRRCCCSACSSAR
jgi:threonine/homoserine/homoserine lactone efflux protein